MSRLADIDITDKKNKVAVLRQIAFQSTDNIHRVIYYPASRHTKIAKSISKPFKPPAKESLGDIEQLPLELIWQLCLHHMDLKSLFYFRQVNRRARQVTDTKEYRMMTRLGISAFRALLVTELAVHISLVNFLAVQTSKFCSACGKHGGYVFLPSWQRCCYHCAMSAHEFNVQPLPFWRTGALADNVDASFLSQVRTFDGPKTKLRGLAREPRVSLLAVGHAMAIDKKETKLLLQPMKLDELNDKHRRKYTARAVTALPYINKETERMMPTVSCTACLFDPAKFGTWYISRNSFYERLEYTPNDLLTHFKESCKGAAAFWDIDMQRLRGIPKYEYKEVMDTLDQLRKMEGCPIMSD